MTVIVNEFELTPQIGPDRVEICYQRLGNLNAPPVLLIMGVAAQLIHWPEEFCQALINRGLQVVRFDNRDSGLSTHLKDAPTPNLPAVLAGDHSSASYNLSDMAQDALGLLDHLGHSQAHFVGASMGGQIAQTAAIEHPNRVLSLTSMMSTTGDPDVGQPSAEILRELFSGPPAVTRDEVIQNMVHAARCIGSPAWPTDDEEVAARSGRAYDRCYDPAGTARQAVATVVSGNRTEALRRLNVATLVIHGLADRMVDISGGQATADAIPDAELILVEGMGHNLPKGLRTRLADTISDFIWKVERSVQSPEDLYAVSNRGKR